MKKLFCLFVSSLFFVGCAAPGLPEKPNTLPEWGDPGPIGPGLPKGSSSQQPGCGYIFDELSKREMAQTILRWSENWIEDATHSGYSYIQDQEILENPFYKNAKYQKAGFMISYLDRLFSLRFHYFSMPINTSYHSSPGVETTNFDNMRISRPIAEMEGAQLVELTENGTCYVHFFLREDNTLYVWGRTTRMSSSREPISEIINDYKNRGPMKLIKFKDFMNKD